MATRNFDWIRSLEENPSDIFLDSTSILLKLMDNVIRNPSNPRFRSIRIGNPTVSRKLMSAVGAMECLFEIGFEEDEDKLTLPERVSVDYLIEVREELTRRRNHYLSLNMELDEPVAIEPVTNLLTTEQPTVATEPVNNVPSGESFTQTMESQDSGQSVEGNQSEPLPEDNQSEPLPEDNQGEPPPEDNQGEPPPEDNQSGPAAEHASGSNPAPQPADPDDWSPIVTRVVGNMNPVNRNRARSRREKKVELPKFFPGVSGVISPEVVAQREQFAQSIRNLSYNVLQYEDKNVQRAALKLIPVKQLEAAAEEKMHNIRLEMKKSPDKEQDIDIMELVLIELLNWFKNSFFRWFDSPICKSCDSETRFGGLSIHQPDLTETKRVEVYICKRCHIRSLFPRYNDVRKLLKTRLGRCGEWASCFTLLCRAMGWEARHVVDQTDHVWTEVYSLTQGRWLHCDPCENVCDQPLLYEKGWGKKLSYIIAYSCDDVQDVTWRYTADYKETLSRRNLCSEDELLEILWQVRQERQKALSDARRAFLKRRLLGELVEFLLPPQGADIEYKGRTSGSLAWRLARGEMEVPASITPYVWEPTKEEIALCCMQVQYSSVLDTYIRPVSRGELKCWHKGVYQASGIFRKEERDWMKAYLARADGVEKGSIQWKIDCSNSELIVDCVTIRCVRATFKTGKIVVTVFNEDFSVQIPTGVSMFETLALKGSQSFVVSAELSGGEGEVAWQHSQLFRQDLDKILDFPFYIHIKFKRL